MSTLRGYQKGYDAKGEPEVEPDPMGHKSHYRGYHRMIRRSDHKGFGKLYSARAHETCGTKGLS